MSTSFGSTAARDAAATRTRRFVGSVGDVDSRDDARLDEDDSDRGFRVHEGRRGTRQDDPSLTSRLAGMGHVAASGLRGIAGGRDSKGRDRDSARRSEGRQDRDRGQERGRTGRLNTVDMTGWGFDPSLTNPTPAWQDERSLSSLGQSRRSAGTLDGWGGSSRLRGRDAAYGNVDLGIESRDRGSSRWSRPDSDRRGLRADDRTDSLWQSDEDDLADISPSRRGSLARGDDSSRRSTHAFSRRSTETRGTGRRTSSSERLTRNGKRPLLYTLAEAPSGAARGLAGIAGFVRAHAIVLVMLCAIAFTVSQGFGPVRDYYLARRKAEVLARTYETIEAQNEQLRDDVARLQTKEGIEDEAHRHGYVHQGEVRVVIDDLNENDVDDWKLDATGDIEVVEEREWYIELLDGFFGFDPKEQ